MRQASNYLEGRKDIRCRTLVVALATALAISGCTLRDSLLSGSAGDDAPAPIGALSAGAEAGDVEQQYRLAMRYLKGDGVERDEQKATYWFEAAAEGGHAASQYLLGAAYYSADGRERDYDQAHVWLGKAAKQGHRRAQYLLGDAYANGRGVPTDPAWAARWYGKAAEQGHVEGQFMLGALAGAGLGVPRDMARSFFWLSLAARQGHAKAGKARDNVATKLTRQQRIRAQARIKRWAPAAPGRFADRPTVRYVQFALEELGHPVGAIDGIQGPQTFRAIAEYQHSVGMARDRAVSRSLVERLRADTNKRE